MHCLTLNCRPSFYHLICYFCETWLLLVEGQHKFKKIENKLLKEIFIPKRRKRTVEI
jgi:hypothetical protein